MRRRIYREINPEWKSEAWSGANVPVHATEVLLAMIGSVELLVAHVALERLLLAVDRFVARVQIAPIRGVRTVRARVALVSADGGRALVLALDAVLERQQKLGDLFEDGILAPQRAVRILLIVLAS